LSEGYSGNGSQSVGLQIAPLVLYKPATNDADSTKSEENQNPNSVVQEHALGGHIRMAWQRNKLFKERVQLELLANLRARRNQYSANEIATMQQNGGNNFVWVPITETKCRAGSAWMREVLLPAGERAWQLVPNALPEMPPEFKNALIKKAADQAQQAMQKMGAATGNVMTRDEFRAMAWEIHGELEDQMQSEARKQAEAAATRMEDILDQHMQLGGFYQAMDEFIEDLVTYKAAILIGPIFQQTAELKWLPGWKVSVEKKPRMKWMRGDPFDAFPAPYARDCQKGDYIHRMRFRRDELFDCIGVEGFREDMIREVLRAYSNGHLEAWLWTEAEKQRLVNESMYTFLSPWGLIDVLWYWGSVPGWKLMSWGILTDKDGKDLDILRDYEVEAMLCGPYVIMCRMNPDPLNRRPFHKASFSNIPGAFWGSCPPEMVRTSQMMVNAAASALADNMGMASGPMVWVHNDRLADGETSNDIYPWRVWQLKSDPSQGVNPGVGFFQPEIISEKLQNIVDKWDVRADDDCGIPRYTYGNEQVAGAADTYSGLSMLMNNAAKGLRRAVSSVDYGVLGPSLQMAYEYEMLHGADIEAKGDCYLQPRGANAILVKEAQRQGQLQGLQLIGGSPMAMQIVGMQGYGKLLRQVFRSMEIQITDDIVPDDDQLQQKQQQLEQQQMQMQQAQTAMGQAQQQLEQQKLQIPLQVQAMKDGSHEKIEGAKIGAKHASEARQLAQPQPAMPQQPAAPQPQPAQG